MGIAFLAKIFVCVVCPSVNKCVFDFFFSPLPFSRLHKCVCLFVGVCERVHRGTGALLWACQGAARVIGYAAAVGHPSEIMS